jgi:2-methylisocitrate lyase-like PEP mutase family enzyme
MKYKENKAMETRKALRTMLEERKPVLAPGAWDPLNALIVESLGFKVCYMGGWITGAHLAITEPMTTLTEMVENAARVAKVIKIPLIVDADAGFGDALHTMRSVREFEFAGVAAIHIEDQVYPKRAHYHKGVKHVVPLDEFLDKLRAALEARTDPDFVIIARTDSRNMVGGSLKETIERCQAFVEAGVDMISPHITDIEEYRTFRREVPDIPIMEWISREFAEELDMQIVLDPLIGIVASVEATIEHYRKFMETGDSKITPHVNAIMEKIQELIHLPEYYRVEEETTEGRWQKDK